jgi:hypothetical protein
VNAANREFEDSGNPAKNRAVSSAVAASEPRIGAAPSVSMNVIKTAAFDCFDANGSLGVTDAPHFQKTVRRKEKRRCNHKTRR